MPRVARTDAAWAIGVMLALSAVVASGQGDEGFRPLAFVWAGGFAALMLWRRQRPVLVLALSVLGLFGWYAAGLPAIGVAVPVAAALLAAAERGHLVAALIAIAVVLAVSSAARLVEGDDVSFVVGYEAVSHLALMGAAVGLGDSLRQRRDAEARRVELAQATAQGAALETERRLEAERLVVARRLHDSIGQSLTVATLHTDVAGEAIDHDAPAALRALDHARAAVAEGLCELRETVRLLRAGDATDPAGTLDDVPALVDRARAAGLAVEATVAVGPLPALVEDTAVRVVHESVTNVLRHAGATQVCIRLDQDGDTVRVEVDDDGGTAARPDGADGPTGRLDHGAGLLGLRERVHALGGTFAAGPTSGGWQVRALLPLGPA